MFGSIFGPRERAAKQSCIIARVGIDVRRVCRQMIRDPTIEELAGLSEFCLRSKAVWGYDSQFLEACRGELSFNPRDLQSTSIAVVEHAGKVVGVVQVKVSGQEADLLKLFVEPDVLRRGVGRVLLGWASDVARQQGATCLMIDSDPDAAAFYRRMGAHDVGQAPSGSIREGVCRGWRSTSEARPDQSSGAVGKR